MRRYKIVIGNETFDSAPGGRANPNALLVEMDIGVTSVDAPQNGAFVRIWGLGLKAISQSRNYYGKSIEVHGGMAAGLPLARPGQFGLLAKGVITQAYGEWEGTNQSLTLIFTPGGSPACAGGPNPMPPKKNIVMNWKKGQKIDDPLRQALQAAYPGMEVAINLKEKITADQDQPSYHASLYELGHHLRRLTQMMVGGHYPGVSIDISGWKIKVFDEPRGGSTIKFDDLVGMPTWIGPQTIQVKTIMRGDITVDQKITLPRTFVNSSQSGAPVGAWVEQQMAFTGDWSVQSIRHVGNSRAPSGDAWVSIFECYSNALENAETQDCPSREGGL
ncbi:MAG: hypothetical protein N2444_00030 [Methylocystis sp.]|nr:hypothetical protein [Methylocystis sp.]